MKKSVSKVNAMNPLASTITLTLCLLASSALTGLADAKSGSSRPVTKTTPDSARVTGATKHKLRADRVKPPIAEAANIMTDTQKAMAALGNKDANEAKALLREVAGRLDALIARNPGLALLPVEVSVQEYDFTGTGEDIRAIVKKARQMLDDGHLQRARSLISGMASEIRIISTAVPLGTYPDAVKHVITLLDAGKTDEASAALADTLDTLEITTEVMPLPVFRAEELLNAAAELEHRKDLSQEQNRRQIRSFTQAAKAELEKAQLLGYGDKNDYKVLYQAIEGIDQALFTEKSAVAWQKFKDELGQFKDRLQDLSKALGRIARPAR